MRDTVCLEKENYFPFATCLHFEIHVLLILDRINKVML